MSKTTYLTAPVKAAGMPAGIPYIIGNEAAERFSFYGMKAILMTFMMHYLQSGQGTPDLMKESEAAQWFHTFISAVYFLPLLGAVLADAFLGKYKTILILSVVYCLGHLALAIDSTRLGLSIGLGLIALGSGGIKPCVSAHVGDQFGASNHHLLSKVFGWFYFSINCGSFLATLSVPLLLQKYGPHVAFGLPGVLMLLATWIFWLGRHRFVHIPAGGMGFVRETFSREGLRTMGKVAGLFLFISMFWSLYDQASSKWVAQAGKMDLNLFGSEVLPAQIQAANPALVLIYIPLFSYFLYPTLNRFWRLTPLRKIGLGFFITIISFLIPAWIEVLLARGEKPTVAWQILAYAFLIAGEVLISITALEFAYTQAPRKMKALLMGIYLCAVSLGNAFTAVVNYMIGNFHWDRFLTGPSYYLFFAGLLLLTALAYIPYAIRYREKTYIQEEEVRGER